MYAVLRNIYKLCIFKHSLLHTIIFHVIGTEEGPHSFAHRMVYLEVCDSAHAW